MSIVLYVILVKILHNIIFCMYSISLNHIYMKMCDIITNDVKSGYDIIFRLIYLNSSLEVI